MIRPPSRLAFVVAASVLALFGVALPVAAQTDEGSVLSGACDVALDVHRVGNTLDITTNGAGGVCVTNAGLALIAVEGSVTGVVGWTCAGGVALGGVTITVDHDGGPTMEGNILTEVSSAAGVVQMALVRSTVEGDVAGAGEFVELVTGPIACIVNNEFAVWRGALTFTIAQ